MGLVDYSDSEDSDSEASAQPVLSKQAPAPTKPAFQKVIDRSKPKKIKVDLPSIKPEPAQQDEQQDERPAKRARLGAGGAFSGFNSLLPAPKGRVQSGPKPGVSLKTSSEAAFSRGPGAVGAGVPEVGDAGGAVMRLEEGREEQEEPKIVGKATKFKPLSVGNNKKKGPKKAKPPEEGVGSGKATEAISVKPARSEGNAVRAPPAPAPNPKRSLFSVQMDEAEVPEATDGGTYESITTNAGTFEEQDIPPTYQAQPNSQPSDPNSLQSIASDLNLTPAQRRQLFGRNGKDTDVNITRFNIDSEYAANEQARQAGEVVEHRAVKAIAPGKHSLQQLVNNARTQQGGLEDKWAEGKRERGEAGGKYGWGK